MCFGRTNRCCVRRPRFTIDFDSLRKWWQGLGCGVLAPSTRETSSLHLVNTCQMQLVITMMGLKRGGEEGWLTVRKKAFRAARGALWRGGHKRWGTIYDTGCLWAIGSLLHVPTSAAALVCAYRTCEWWLCEQKKKKGQGVSHPGRLYPFLMNAEKSLTWWQEKHGVSKLKTVQHGKA